MVGREEERKQCEAGDRIQYRYISLAHIVTFSWAANCQLRQQQQQELPHLPLHALELCQKWQLPHVPTYHRRTCLN